MNKKQIPVITIDGPSGAGKGTVSQMLSIDLGWNILDSGALYRTLVYYLKKERISLENFIDKKEQINKAFEVKFDAGTLGKPVRVFFQGKDITNHIRTEEIARETSILAAKPLIRDFIRPCQKEFKKLPGLVADGRDMGTVIFPEAEIKIYLTASLEERANRRYRQLKRSDSKVNMRILLAKLAERDKIDKERDYSPLKPADDSLVIDTTSLDPSKVIEEIKRLSFGELEK